GAIVPMLPEGVESLVATDAVVDLGDVRAEREVRVWLGADGRATDADGGAFVLDGAARPSGALASIDGAREILSSEAGHARFTSGASATVTLVDAAGGRHVLRGDGLASDLSITWEVRW
ncbi:hypothetical protein L6R52_39490, partial [Myxococcota bacterium]|nr:hypothetical protein [Myxococcota bacterium]